MKLATRALACLGGLTLLALLTGPTLQRGSTSPQAFQALADQAVWYSVWSKADVAVTVLEAPKDKAVYITSLHLGTCAERCVNVTLLVNDMPRCVLPNGSRDFAPLVVAPGARLTAVVSEPDIPLSVSGYALSR